MASSIGSHNEAFTRCLCRRGKWPDPEKDKVVFVSNPIEADLPGHWLPLSVLKKSIENRVNNGTTFSYQNGNKDRHKKFSNKKVKLTAYITQSSAKVQGKNHNKYSSIDKFRTESELVKYITKAAKGVTSGDGPGFKKLSLDKGAESIGADKSSLDSNKIAGESKVAAEPSKKAAPKVNKIAADETNKKAAAESAAEASKKAAAEANKKAVAEASKKAAAEAAAEASKKAAAEASKKATATNTEAPTEATTVTTVTPLTEPTTTLPTTTTEESTGNPFY